jgi:hypothetical protein
MMYLRTLLRIYEKKIQLEKVQRQKVFLLPELP